MKVDIAKRIPEIREALRLYFAVYENCTTNQDFFYAYKGMLSKVKEISAASGDGIVKISEEELVQFYHRVVSRMSADNPWGN